MSRSLALFAIGLTFGAGAGFVVAAANGITLDGHDHGDPAHHGGAPDSGGHPAGHHEPLAVDADAAPAVSLSVRPDPASGWNLHLVTDNFRFAPESAGGAHVPGEGHAHLYVNGGKVARLYAGWAHLDELPPGATITVTLNANDHRVYQVDGSPVQAAVTLQN